MKMRVGLLLIGMLLLAGCGGQSDGGGETAVADTITLSTVDSSYDFDNYQFNMDFRFTTLNEAGNPYDQIMRADVMVTTDPAAISMTMNVSGIPELATFGDGSDITMVQLPDATYMAVPSLGCLLAPDDGTIAQSVADLTDANNFLNVVNNAEFVGTETVNGFETHHYQFDRSNLKTDNSENFESLAGDLYLAVDGGYLVRLEMTGSGIISDFVTDQPRNGDLFLTMNLNQANADLVVTAPEECTAVDSATAIQYPQLPDARDTVTMPGMMSYETETAVSEAAAFYVQALTAEGWREDIENAIFNDTTTVLTFTKDETELAVTIGTDPVSGLTSVIIVSE